MLCPMVGPRLGVILHIILKSDWLAGWTSWLRRPRCSGGPHDFTKRLKIDGSGVVFPWEAGWLAEPLAGEGWL